jgi:hypothetical protein
LSSIFHFHRDARQMTWSTTSDRRFAHLQALCSYPSSPVLGGNSLPKPELIRQKTWSIGSIHDLEDASAVTSGPPLTSSPLQSQQALQSLEQLNLEGRVPGVAERLHDACAKIHEALSILNLSQKNKVTTSLHPFNFHTE